MNLLVDVQRALLSPVAGPYNISGVHSVQALLDKFRLPLIVRLVCGVIPTKVSYTLTEHFCRDKQLQLFNAAMQMNANAVYGKVGSLASEEVIVQLMKTKCLPVLYYGLEACPLNKSEIKALDYVGLLVSLFSEIFRSPNPRTLLMSVCYCSGVPLF